MSKRAKKSRDSGSSTKRSRSKGPSSGGTKPMDYQYVGGPRAPPGRHGPEKKAVDDATFSCNFDSNGTIQLVGATSPGPGRWERTGRQLNYKSIHVKGILRYAGAVAASVNNEFARLMLIYDRSPNKAVVAMNDILQNVTNAGATATNVFCGLNLNYTKRFLILRDTKLNLSGINDARMSDVTSPDADGSGVIDWYVKLKDLPCEYAGDTAAIASIATGALYVVSISDEDPAKTQYVFRGSARTRFVDY